MILIAKAGDFYDITFFTSEQHVDQQVASKGVDVISFN